MSETPQEADKQGHWMEETLRQQLSAERDFPHDTPIKFQYAVLCGHRMGSNLFCEALYETGVAGDPMEYFNNPLLRQLAESRNVAAIPCTDYVAEMKKRRTSPNGVFGFNIKFDQLKIYFQQAPALGTSLITDSNVIFFMYRKNKIKQAVSQYIGTQRNTYRIPADANYDEVKKLVEDVTFNPLQISHMLNICIKQEQAWFMFLKRNNLDYVPIAYEDLVSDYEGTLNLALDKIGIAAEDRQIPPQATMKVSTGRNEELVNAYTDLILGNKAIFDLVDPQAIDQQQ